MCHHHPKHPKQRLEFSSLPPVPVFSATAAPVLWANRPMVKLVVWGVCGLGVESGYTLRNHPFHKGILRIQTTGPQPTN